MPRKPVEIPPAAARDSSATCARSTATGEDWLEKDAITARQLHALGECLTDVHDLFLAIRITHDTPYG